MKKVSIVLYCSLALIGGFASGSYAAISLRMVDSISIDGVTWRLSAKVPVGRFVNGDYYVVGPVTITSIMPKPENGRNGSVLNIPVKQLTSGFDDRVQGNSFRENIRVYPPITLKPGDALISSISVDSLRAAPSWLREAEKSISPVLSVSVLTCLEKEVPSDAFRPSYADRTQKIYRATQLRRELLLNLKRVSDMQSISMFAEHFRRPWLEICFFSFDAPVAYQPQYSLEGARAIGMATLLLLCDFTAEEKEPLLINVVQFGIDLWGIVRAGYPGWQAHGGHGSGRKWPLIFAGMLLGDTAMARPNVSYPDLRFGEDMQTMYDQCWTGAKVVYVGHQGVLHGKAVSSTPGWGPYEHKHPRDWADSNQIGETYRRCCTSIGWVGEALAAHLMNARKLWGHDAFFDYVDRWMTEDDSAAVEIIKKERGWDFSAGWQRQRQCWDKFVENMWHAYRDLPIQNIQFTPPKGKGKQNRSLKQTGLLKDCDSQYYSLNGERLFHSNSIGVSGVRIVRWKNNVFLVFNHQFIKTR